jgi:hypothetical protein
MSQKKRDNSTHLVPIFTVFNSIPKHRKRIRSIALLLPSFIKKCPQRIQYYLEWEKMLLEFTILAPMSSIATHPSGFPNQKTRSTALSDARILPDQGSSISIMIP